MIYCKQKDLHHYKGLHPNLDTAIDYILNHTFADLPFGKSIVDGEAVYINRFDYDTVPEPITEGHRLYADVHVVLGGEEVVAVADVSNLKEIERKEDEDYLGFSGEFESMNVMRPGDVLIVFPEDAHSPKRMYGGKSCHVKKAVIKVLV